MNWLIIGGNLQNKGAELMLASVVEEIKKRKPNDNCVVNGATGERNRLKHYNLKILDFALPHIGSNWKFIPIVLIGNIFKYFKKKYQGEISLNQIDIVLDISGYAYGDIWGIRPIKNVFFLINYFTKKGIRYIFLPQAFGPFDNQISKSLMKKVVEKAALCFVRDETSYNNLMCLDTTLKNIFISSDISLRSRSKDFKPDSFISFIPNERMLDKAGDFWRENYLNIIIECLKLILRNSSFTIKIIIHDKNTGDIRLANLISKSIQSRVEIVNLDDPRKLKSVIAKSQFLISSRFHGLASGLSNNVPSIAIGWSHKYYYLLNDYKLSDFVITERSDVEKLHGLIFKLLNNAECEIIRKELYQRNIVMKQKIDNMWDKVMTISEISS